MIDPRPLCIRCGKPWLPNEGMDATQRECFACEAGAFYGRKPDDTNIYVMTFDGARVRRTMKQGDMLPRRPHKIGFAKSIYFRLAHVQTCHPTDVSVVALFFRKASYEDELQARFAKHWISGEWFALSGLDVSALRAEETEAERIERGSANEQNARRRAKRGRWRGI